MRPTTSGKAPTKSFLEGRLKRPQRYWLGIVVLCEICWYQRNTKLLIHKQPFVCLLHKIVQEHGVHDLHIKVCVVQAL